MHVVDEVPLLPAWTSPIEALRAMRTHQRSAVVRQSQSSFDLILIPDVFEAWIRQLSELSNIEVSAPAYRISAADISNCSLDLNDPYRTKLDYEALLDSVGYLYALMKPLAGTVSIVTRHEPDGEYVGEVPRQCQCKGPLRHGFPEPHVTHGQDCPECQFEVRCF